MKKVILVFTLIFALACKSEKKEGSENNIPANEETTLQQKEEKILDTLTIPQADKWTSKNMAMSPTEEAFQGSIAHELKRDEVSTSSYSIVGNISVFAGSKYRITVFIKKSTSCGLFGLRFRSTYPNRADVIFDLNSGTIKGTNSIVDFENESADIEDLGDGWYKCSLTSEVFSERISISLGPTDGNAIIPNWESGTQENCNIIIAPSSILLEELAL